jgi:hypothetical protein
MGLCSPMGGLSPVQPRGGLRSGPLGARDHWVLWEDEQLPLPLHWVIVGQTLGLGRRLVKQSAIKGGVMLMQTSHSSTRGQKMLAPHNWPKPVKRLLLTSATLLVILAYALLCAGSLILTAALFSQIRP